MNPELKAFLESIQKRAFSGSGIGTAAGYVQTVLSVAKSDGYCRQFPNATAADFAAVMKAAGDKLVYRCPVQEPLTAITKAAAGGKRFETFGSPVRKDAGVSAASVMDFENILTTKQQDRDGDILHPKGCKVDPSAPLLWQHLPTEPIGKMVQVVEVTDDHIKTHCAIADTPLGNLSAKLVEFGALRISHGFKPLKWKALGDSDSSGGMITGWEVEECEVMEVSLVSVPANIGAVITAYQKNQKSFALAGPMIEAWAKGLWTDRPAAVVSGFGGTYRKGKVSPVVVTVNLNGHPTKKAGDKPEDDEDDDKKKEETPKADPDATPPKEDDKPDGDAKTNNLLSDIAERAEAMSQDEKLSNEARARCSVVGGILRDVGAGIASAMEALQAAAEAQDLAKITAAQQELSASCGNKLQRAAAELASLLEAAGELDEGAAGAVQEMAEAVGASLAGVMPASQDGGDGGGDWVQLEGEEDGEEKEGDEEEEDDDEDDSELEEVEEDGEEKEGDEEEEKEDDDYDDEKESDEDDQEEKEGDEDDREEKEEGDESTDDKADDEDDREEKADDDEEEEEPKKAKPKSIDLTKLARKLAADAMSGEPANLAEHRTLSAAVMAGGKIDVDTLVMYRSVCGAVLKKLAAKKK